MTVTVVAEGRIDAAIIGGALGDRSDVRVLAASGRSEADSYARTVLASGHEPVLLVVDADTVDESARRQRAAFHEASLREVASCSRWRVVLIAPTIEAVLFQDGSVAQALFGHLSPEQSVEARYVPKLVAAKALNGKPLLDALATLTPREWQAIRELPDIRRVLDSVEQLKQNGACRPALVQ